MKIKFFYINQQGEVLTMHCKKPIVNQERILQILKQSYPTIGKSGLYVSKDPVVYSPEINMILN